MRLLIVAALLVCAKATPQYVKTAGVKGGYGGQGYRGGENLVSYYNNTRPGYGVRNHTAPRNYEIGVCYVEVPTASLVKDPSHVPAGNGSRPDLSRIRTCCKGYVRNIHNFRICDPVCTQDCVNSLCTAPETCTCFPDHVKNLAGFCIPTCPIGCQNGQCAGGECICKDGYRLDSESKFCVPYCQGQCNGGGGGNCTAPNRCECRTGYSSTPDGSCGPACDRCTNGQCVGPNDCRCVPGYSKNQYGDCVPQHASIQTTTPPSLGQHPNQNSTETTRNPYVQRPQEPYNQGSQQSYNPSYSQSNQQYPNNPGYQQSGYPNQQQNYPGNQQPGSPSQQPNYPGYQQPGSPSQQPNYPGYQQPGSPSQQPNYPGYQPNNPSHQPSYPNSHLNPSSNQPTYPGQKPTYLPNGQVIYIQYPSGQQLYPESQHGYQDQRPTYSHEQHSGQSSNTGSSYHESQHYGTQYQQPNNPQPNSSQSSPNTRPSYPNGQYYPGSYYPNQQAPPNNAEPYYPNSQYYPAQNGQPQYVGYNPYNSGNHESGFEQSHVSAVEMLCSQPCINGTCVGRDQCACKGGYVPIDSDTSRCEPRCSGCTNGQCVSPYVCICNPGYYKDFSVKGQSACVRRIRRSVTESKPDNVADLLVFEIPDDEE